MNRRHFLMTAAGASAFLAARKRLYGFYQSPGLQKFIQPLRGITTIPVAKPDATPAPVTGVTHYTIDINEYQDTLHPSLGPTTLWGYHPRMLLTGTVQKHLGGIIVVRKGVPLQITFQNNLPPRSIVPIDTGGFFPDAAVRPNATATHLHGGFVPWISDGGPFDWWTPTGVTGPSFKNNVILNPTALINQAEYFYPNQQSARLVWYHDHAHDVTRTNAYSGIASAYIIRDAFEDSLVLSHGLPDYIEKGGREIPIVVQDKVFVDANTIGYFDPDWLLTGCPATTGSLWYPHFYDYKRWQLGLTGNPGIPGAVNSLPPKPSSCIPEMFGDTMLVNGAVFPFVNVDPRRYRLRVLNACNARFLNLQTYVDDGTADSITLNAAGNPTNKPGPDYIVIGTEGGFLHTPHKVNASVPYNPVTMKGSLITAPAERWDIIIDFSAFAGKSIILYNDAPAPFPLGDPANDAYFGGPGSPTHPGPGFGPNTRQLMRFVVANIPPPVDPPLGVVPGFNMKPGLDPFMVTPGTSVTGGNLVLPTVTAQGKPVKPVRRLTLNEDFDQWGRLTQTIGTDQHLYPNTLGRLFLDAATEMPKVGDVEIWEIANLTGDTHPIHFHLVNVQVLARRPFNALTYAGGGNYTWMGPPVNPDPTEHGWKETVKMNPGEVTWVMMEFTLPTVPFTVPLSNRASIGLPAGSAGCHEYVYHCHILEHEEHDMMRTLAVLP